MRKTRRGERTSLCLKCSTEFTYLGSLSGQIRLYCPDCFEGRSSARARASNRGKRQMRDELKSAPCADCGVSYPPYVMDFDHRVGTTKLFHLGEVSRNLDEWLAEAAKCDVVCSNCHRERTHQQKLRGTLAKRTTESRPRNSPSRAQFNHVVQ